MDLKDWIFLMRDRIRERSGTTIEELAAHFGVGASFVAGWFSRTHRVPAIYMLEELADLAGLKAKEIQGMKDAWVEWRCRKGAHGHVFDTVFDLVIPKLSPKDRRTAMDQMFEAEAKVVNSRFRGSRSGEGVGED